MKYRLKQLISSACALILLGNIQVASADLASDAETLLNWAENTYPELFPSPRATQSLEPWLYRFYPETNTYAGVNKNDNGVYVMGGPWGDNPTYIDSLASLITTIQNSGGNSSIPACNTANAPAGFSYSQSGNVVTITTNGQCIEIPNTTNFCETPVQPTQTGISVLSTSSITSAEWRGISFNLTLPTDPLASLTGTFKHCTINAPAEQLNLVVNSDICMDMTQQLQGSFESAIAAGYVTINPPITYATKSTYSGQAVSDCFATDADNIYDAFTQDVWIKQEGGGFVKIDSQLL